MPGPFMQIEVSGLRDLQKGLKNLGEVELPKAIRLAGKAIGQQVSSEVRTAAAAFSKSGRLASTVTYRATKTSVSIKAGGTRGPYWKFIDFGGSVGRGHHKGGGGAIKRDFQSDGRIMYPTVRKDRPQVIRQYHDALERAIREAGFKGRGIH